MIWVAIASFKLWQGKAHNQFKIHSFKIQKEATSLR
jgi:hypothetical protein